MNKTVDLTKEFAVVDIFESPTGNNPHLTSDDKQDALYIIENTLFIETSRELNEPNVSLDEQSMFLNEEEYIIDYTLMKFYTNNINPTCLRIYKFHTKRFSGAKKLFRCIIPHFRHNKAVFHNSFDANLLCSVSDPHTMRGLNGICANINKSSCYVYYIEDKLVIESYKAQDYDDFFKMCVALTSMVGFFTGYCQKDKGYIFEYDDFSKPFKGYTYDAHFSDTFSTQHCLISSNPSKYKRQNDISSSQPFNGSSNGLGVATKKVFETMYEQIETNDDFNLAFYSLENILNGHKLSPLDNALLCVTLETLTGLISSQNEEKLTWHKDKAIKRAHKKGLLNFSRDYFVQNNIPDWDDSYIKKRINDIDAPTNKDKLTKSFSLLGITLTKDEEDALKRRNDFLHGRHGYDLGETTKFLKDFYTLNYLVYALFLKYVGFSGKIINKNKDFGDVELYKQL